MNPNAFRISVFLCASATGIKLRPFIVFAGVPGGAVDEELRASPAFDLERAHFAVQKKAYCDERTMIQWIEEVYKPEIKWCSLLVLDSLRTHKMTTVKERLEEDCATQLAFVPPGATGLCQPMDLTVMRSFKARCRQHYSRQVIEGGFALTAARKRQAIAKIVVEAWNEISEHTIRQGFIKAGIIPIGPRNKCGSFGVEEVDFDDSVVD